MNKLNPYDEFLYLGYPFPQTHPDRMATLATLFGMIPTAVESSRVLELGCGDGANLIPMAFGLPGSEFLGIDLAPHAIARGTILLEALGLNNIKLQVRDVLDVTAELGLFDYIIAHGVYSWVPPVVQNKILEICKKNLAAQGVAYVSYNTYPGGHLRQMVREMMLFHVRDFHEPQERIGQARALVKFLSDSQSRSDEYAMFLKKELDLVLARADGALYHDDLAVTNAPVYFYQFVEQAAAHGLQYLSEADPLELKTRGLFPLPTDMFQQSGVNVVVQEQYLDFLKCRRFRQTLLCHHDVVLDRTPRPEWVKNFYIASSARPLSAAPDIVSASVVEEFCAASGAVMSTSNPLAKAAIVHLGAIWPQGERFDGLVRKAHGLLGDAKNGSLRQRDQEAAALCELLSATYGSDVIDLHVHQPSFATFANDRPVVSPLARLQAQHSHILTTLRHTMIEVKDDLAKNLVALLDGTRDRAALVTELTAALSSGQRNAHIDGASEGAEPPLSKISFEQLEEKLSELARLALLVG